MSKTEKPSQKKPLTPGRRKFRSIRNTAFALAAASMLYVAHRSNVRQEKIIHQEKVLTGFIEKTARSKDILDKGQSYMNAYGHFLNAINEMKQDNGDSEHKEEHSPGDENYNNPEKVTFSVKDMHIVEKDFIPESGKRNRKKDALLILCKLNLALANEEEHLKRKEKFLPEINEIKKTITENRAVIGEENLARFNTQISEITRIIEEPHKRNIELIEEIAEITSKYKGSELRTSNIGAVVVLGKRDHNIYGNN